MRWFVKKTVKSTIQSPVSGVIIPLKDVQDDVFSKSMMGPGFAVKPTSRTVLAPCDGEIKMLFPTLHAFGLTTPTGDEVLVHIGLDTVNLNGRAFKQLVKTKRVKAGTPMINVNLKMLRDLNYDSTVIVVVTKTDKQWRFNNKSTVTAGQNVGKEE